MNTAIKMTYIEEWNHILKKLIKRRSIVNYEHLNRVIQAKKELNIWCDVCNPINKYSNKINSVCDGCKI